MAKSLLLLEGCAELQVCSCCRTEQDDLLEEEKYKRENNTQI